MSNRNQQQDDLNKLLASLENLTGLLSDEGGDGGGGGGGGGGRDADDAPLQKRDREIDVGVVAQLHSLQSTRGQELNGQKCLILDKVQVEDGVRWNVLVEENVSKNSTTAVKPENLRLIDLRTESTSSNGEEEPHPDDMEMTNWLLRQMVSGRNDDDHAQQPPSLEKKYRNARGVAFDDDPPMHQARKLVELMDLGNPETGYVPHSTMIYGLASRFYGMVPESSMMHFVQCEMEHMAAMLGLAHMCQEGMPEIAAFAILEKAPVTLDVLLYFLVGTPFIGPAEDLTEPMEQVWSDCRPGFDLATWTLTPDQTHKDYCTAMRGPIGLLSMIGQTQQKKEHTRMDKVFFRRIQQHVLFSKAIERLCRLVAREIMGTPDGKSLGIHARIALVSMADQKGTMSVDLYNTCHQKKWGETTAVAEQLLQKKNIQSFDELEEFVKEVVVISP